MELWKYELQFYFLYVTVKKMYLNFFFLTYNYAISQVKKKE